MRSKTAEQLPLDQDSWIYYETDGQGQPVVFLNGIMMTITSWVFQRKYFHQKYRCIFHDFRDQLMSSKSSRPYGMDLHAEDLARLLDHLGIDQCHVIGTSYGGEVGMWFALQYPHRVKSLSIIASVSHSDLLLSEQVRLWQKTALHYPEMLYQSLAILSFSNSFFEQYPDLVEKGRQRLQEYLPDFFQGFARLCDAFLKLDLSSRLKDITPPTLVIAAGKDILKPPAYSEFIAREVPKAEFRIVPGAGHAVVLEQPDHINDWIDQFIQNHS